MNQNDRVTDGTSSKIEAGKSATLPTKNSPGTDAANTPMRAPDGKPGQQDAAVKGKDGSMPSTDKDRATSQPSNDKAWKSDNKR